MAAIQRFPVVTTKLSNELPMVKCFQITEAEFMYKQLFEDSEYAKHGISIRKGDTVFDVGANIGMFGLHCILSTEGDVKLFSFEPIPYLAAICEENIREYAKRGLTLRKVFAFGLTQPSLLTAENSAIFDFYPNYSLVSSSYGYSNEEKDSIASRLKNLSEGKLSQEATRRIVDDSMVAVKIKCPLRTLSAVLDEEIPGTIDLLKIDVEKAEWDVLMGIRDDHWPLIRQVVMETHVVGDSVEMVVQLLQKKGFSKVVVGSDAAVRPPTVKIVKLGDTVGLTASVTVRKSE